MNEEVKKAIREEYEDRKKIKKPKPRIIWSSKDGTLAKPGTKEYKRIANDKGGAERIKKINSFYKEVKGK